VRVEDVAFQWDAANTGWLWRRHRVRPRHAEQAFLDPDSLPVDASNLDSELRQAVIGMAEGPRLLHLVWTERGDAIRILHARNATEHEAELYFRQ